MDTKENLIDATESQHISDNSGPENIYDKTSFWLTFMSLMRMTVGIGILSLPDAMKSSGIIAGPLIILAVGLMLTYNMIILSKANREQMERTKLDLGLSESIEYSIQPYIGERKSYIIRHFFNGFIVVYLMGACSLYFISSKEVMIDIFNATNDKKELYTYIALLSTLPLSFIPKAFVASIISTIANILSVTGLLCIFFNSLVKLVTNFTNTTISPPEILLGPEEGGLIIAINSIIFTFEVMSSLIPVVNTIDKPSKIPLLLKISNAITIVLYLLIAIVGYMAYGNDIKSVLILNMPKNIFFNIVRGVFSIGLMLSFVVLTFCIITIVLPPILNNVNTVRPLFLELLARFFVVVISISVATIGPYLSTMLGILGAVFALPISFIIPPLVSLLNIMRYHPDSRTKSRRIILHMILLIFGVILYIIGIIGTIMDLIPKTK